MGDAAGKTSSQRQAHTARSRRRRFFDTRKRAQFILGSAQPIDGVADFVVHASFILVPDWIMSMRFDRGMAVL